MMWKFQPLIMHLFTIICELIFFFKTIDDGVSKVFYILDVTKNHEDQELVLI